ncbi:MAG: CoA synthetase [Burkholderiaceae bacterium]
MSMITLAELATRIPDGIKLAVPKDDTGVSVAAIVALVRRGIKNLHLVCLPTSGLPAELLIGAGCVRTLETSAITLGEYGAAPQFGRIAKDGSVKLVDATCPAVYAGMQASQKGIPFIPLRGIFNSDLLTNRADWTIIDNPFTADDPIVAIGAIDPNVALFHAEAGDRFGNVFMGRNRDCLLMAHASKASFCTVETIVEGNLLDDPARAGAVVPAMYLDGVAHVPQAAWPVGFGDDYPVNDQWMKRYVSEARDCAGFDAWLDDLIDQAPWAAEVESIAKTDVDKARIDTAATERQKS